MKVFCLSAQRTGTTSMGRFLRDNKFNVCGWRESKSLKLSELWYDGKLDEMFSAIEKRGFTGFEDSPWYYPGIEVELYRRYPDAKYILMERDPDAWFKSMLSHSGGKNPGSARIHARIYGREADLGDLGGIRARDGSDWNMLELQGHAEHYKRIYVARNEKCRAYLAGQGADLYHGRLEEIDWGDIAAFIGLDRPVFRSGSTHANRSRGRRFKQFLRSLKKSVAG
ncbi:sulfotransferase [Cribrihabitans pelagius]|uniref:sulfotransferase n=1 Tax=Cribrihabitans pelagius TaxID=1765746 RepID=UPI003B599D2C